MRERLTSQRVALGVLLCRRQDVYLRRFGYCSVLRERMGREHVELGPLRRSRVPVVELFWRKRMLGRSPIELMNVGLANVMSFWQERTLRWTHIKLVHVGWDNVMEFWWRERVGRVKLVNVGRADVVGFRRNSGYTLKERMVDRRSLVGHERWLWTRELLLRRLWPQELLPRWLRSQELLLWWLLPQELLL